MARGERPRLLRRFREIVVLSTNLSIAVAALFALLNNTFVQVWTFGKMGWSPWNDLLLALWLVICVSVHANTGLVGQTKAFHFLRYLYFIEGLIFVGLVVLLHRFGGMTLMLGLSIACSLTFSLPYGLRRTRRYFNLNWADLARWHEAALIMSLYLVPVGVLVWWFTRNLSPAARLVVGGVGFGLWNLWVFLRHELDESLRVEMFQRAPGWARPTLARISFARA